MSEFTKSLPRNTILGVQFLFVAFGATVLVPLLVGINPSIALFSAGVGTLLFHLITRGMVPRSEEHTSELQSRPHLVCRLLLEKKNNHPHYRSFHYHLTHPNYQ